MTDPMAAAQAARTDSGRAITEASTETRLVQTPCIRAQVWLGGDRFELREFDTPALAPGEALAAIELATVCGSDVHTVTGRRPGAHPSILGHESVGRIVATHPAAPTYVDGSPVGVGDRLVWGVAASCGACDRCAAGRTAKCRHLLKTGHEPLTGPWGLSGGYATHIVLRRGLPLVAAPESVADGPAAMSACALATVMACLDPAAAGSLPGTRVLVVGAGMLGLCACAVAARSGAARVVVRDPVRERAAQALRFGADAIWGSGGIWGSAEPLVLPGPGAQATTERPGTSGERLKLADVPELFDVAVELSGHPGGVAIALDALDIGGRAVLAGSVAPTAPQAFDPERIVRRHLRITGVHNYEPVHLEQAMAFLAGPGSSYPWGELIAPALPLESLPHEMLATGRLLRRAMTPLSPHGCSHTTP